MRETFQAYILALQDTICQALEQLDGKSRFQEDHWKRAEASTSHYFRPLKYHGHGVVDQHGPNGGAKIEAHVEGQYKMR